MKADRYIFKAMVTVSCFASVASSIIVLFLSVLILENQRFVSRTNDKIKFLEEKINCIENKAKDYGIYMGF